VQAFPTSVTRADQLDLPDDGDVPGKQCELHLIARTTPIRAKKLSIVKRLTRFWLSGGAGTGMYHPFAAWLLLSAANTGQVI